MKKYLKNFLLKFNLKFEINGEEMNLEFQFGPAQKYLEPASIKGIFLQFL